jgi:quinol-cytochrome oxidoreductase complex cytochrome b subunit
MYRRKGRDVTLLHMLDLPFFLCVCGCVHVILVLATALSFPKEEAKKGKKKKKMCRASRVPLSCDDVFHSFLFSFLLCGSQRTSFFFISVPVRSTIIDPCYELCFVLLAAPPCDINRPLRLFFFLLFCS